jgi:uncharacterized protein (DUF58 family)
LKHEILEPDFIKRLERLSLLSKKIFAGKVQSLRRSTHKGHSAEFSDYRSYEQGDDLRYIDWNIYARLEKLLIKLFVAEEELSLNIIVDNSKSMCCPDDGKLLYAKKIAAALSYISLANLDRVGICAFSKSLSVKVFPSRGKKHFFTCAHYLNDMEEDSGTNINKALIDFANTMTVPGVVVVISDFFDPDGYENGLNYLLYKKFDVNVVQIVSPEENDINLIGDLRLTDIETEDFLDVTVTEKLSKMYLAEFEYLCENLQTFCLRRGITYLKTVTDTDFEELILKYFKVKRMVKSK